ncbi:MAG: hypothetical protein R3C52_07555 [Hyphomonadaceae bacterium]
MFGLVAAKGAIRACAASALACVAAGAARADNAGQPMTFEWGKAYGDTDAIFADGDLTPDTPKALQAFLERSEVGPDTRIYLNSLGGDLTAGMQLGRVIRAAHLNTGVGRNKRDPDEAEPISLAVISKVYPGYCVSACTLAFLGGVSRRVDPGGTYAVHQVSMDCVDKRQAVSRFPWTPQPGVNYCPELGDALSMVQIASGAVVEYVRSMGVDPLFLSEMAKAGPNTINALTESQLDAYRINFTMRTTSWSFETDAHGQFYLKHTQGDEWKEDRVEFYCDRSAGPRLFMWMVHVTTRSNGRIDPNYIVDLAGDGLTAKWQTPPVEEGGLAQIDSAALEPIEIINPPAATEYENVTLTIDLSQRLQNVMMQADKFQLVTTRSEHEGGPGFTLIAMDIDRDKLAGIARSCQ